MTQSEAADHSSGVGGLSFSARLDLPSHVMYLLVVIQYTESRQSSLTQVHVQVEKRYTSRNELFRQMQVPFAVYARSIHVTVVEVLIVCRLNTALESQPVLDPFFKQYWIRIDPFFNRRTVVFDECNRGCGCVL